MGWDPRAEGAPTLLRTVLHATSILSKDSKTLGLLDPAGDLSPEGVRSSNVPGVERNLQVRPIEFRSDSERPKDRSDPGSVGEGSGTAISRLSMQLNTIGKLWQPQFLTFFTELSRRIGAKNKILTQVDSKVSL